MADFEPLLSRVQSCGGEIAIAFIGPRAYAFGGRQFFIPPPRGQPTIIRASAASDPFTEETLAKTAEAARIEREREIENWRRDAAMRMADFRQALNGALERLPDRPRTNIQASLDEIDTFFKEPRHGGAYQKILVAFTDGIDNVARKPLRGMTSRPRIVVVNQLGAANLGVFGPLVFGDPAAAIRYLAEGS